MRIPNELKAIILNYAATWELVGWVNIDSLDWEELASNPNAIDLMISSPYWACWNRASSNGNAWPYLRDHLSVLIIYDDLAESNNPEAVAYACANIDKFNDSPIRLSANPLAIDWLTKNPKYICWDYLLRNPAAEDLLRAYGILERLPRAESFNVDLENLCFNTAPWALKIVEANIQNDCSYCLSANPSATDILIKYYGQNNIRNNPYLDFEFLALNTDPRAVELIMDNEPYVISWYNFSTNPTAYPYLYEHRERVNYEGLSRNPRIFEPKWPVRVFEKWCAWEANEL